MRKAGEITQEEHPRRRYKHPKFDTTRRWVEALSKAPSVPDARKESNQKMTNCGDEKICMEMCCMIGKRFKRKELTDLIKIS